MRGYNIQCVRGLYLPKLRRPKRSQVSLNARARPSYSLTLAWIKIAPISSAIWTPLGLWSTIATCHPLSTRTREVARPIPEAIIVHQYFWLQMNWNSISHNITYLLQWWGLLLPWFGKPICYVFSVVEISDTTREDVILGLKMFLLLVLHMLLWEVCRSWNRNRALGGGERTKGMVKLLEAWLQTSHP